MTWWQVVGLLLIPVVLYRTLNWWLNVGNPYPVPVRNTGSQLPHLIDKPFGISPNTVLTFDVCTTHSEPAIRGTDRCLVDSPFCEVEKMKFQLMPANKVSIMMDDGVPVPNVRIWIEER